MTTTNEPPPFRWTRLIPRQFSLRALLVLITIVALSTWWYVQPLHGCISDAQVNSLTPKMTKAEISAAVGEPYERLEFGNREVWPYPVFRFLETEKEDAVLVFFEKHTGVSYAVQWRYLGPDFYAR